MDSHNGREGVKRGAWSKEEDNLLKKCVQTYGEGRWHLVPLRAGLNRCRKSCRLRWVNYLSPCIKRGCFTEDEVDLLTRLHKLLGNRWSLIAGRIPGRTANDVKNFWNSHMVKMSSSPRRTSRKVVVEKTKIIKPKPLKLPKLVDMSNQEPRPNSQWRSSSIVPDTEETNKSNIDGKRLYPIQKGSFEKSHVGDMIKCPIQTDHAIGDGVSEFSMGFWKFFESDHDV